MVARVFHTILVRNRMPVTVDDEEALKRRRDRETPRETAARLRSEFGIELSKQAREPLPRQIYDELCLEKTDACRRHRHRPAYWSGDCSLGAGGPLRLTLRRIMPKSAPPVAKAVTK
ncbi:hypothetical protein EB231_00970 [Mesorhizobium sp. NZP2298]|nr:hypothetical protein EB231_00970 [Mesorhizobium sp. NZP2298]